MKRSIAYKRCSNVPIVYIGVGSNLGDRHGFIEKACALCASHGITITRRSTLIETEPVGGPTGQARYINGVIEATTAHSPEALLAALQTIEQHLGRVRTIKYGPRTIDLDILWYEGCTRATPALTIPHPRLTERAFVLIPFKEIAPNIVKELVSHADHTHH
jgi:2-amino-4-hydroxy-6-hydroxymethyldihydropteridine diphosphokinase